MQVLLCVTNLLHVKQNRHSRVWDCVNKMISEIPGTFHNNKWMEMVICHKHYSIFDVFTRSDPGSSILIFCPKWSPLAMIGLRSYLIQPGRWCLDTASWPNTGFKILYIFHYSVPWYRGHNAINILNPKKNNLSDAVNGGIILLNMLSKLNSEYQ